MVPAGVSPVSRTGATSWFGSTLWLPSGETSYSFAKSVASVVPGVAGVTRRVTRAAPTSRTVVASGALVNTACWSAGPASAAPSPGVPVASWDSVPPRPGRLVVAAG